MDLNYFLKNQVKSLYVLFFFSLFVITQYVTVGYNYNAYQSRWYNCINYVLDGTLYSGQPECAQPPLIFFLGAFYSIISTDHVQLLSSITTLLCHTFLLFSLLLIINSKRKGVLIALVAGYLLIIYPLANSAGFRPEDFTLATLLSTTFLFIGIYFYERNKDQYLSQIFFTLSILTKSLNIQFLGVIFIVKNIDNLKQIYRRGFRKRHVLPLVKSFKSFFLLPGIVLIIFALIYPQMIHYAFLSHYLGFESISSAILTGILNSKLIFSNLLFLLLIGIAFIYYKKTKSEYCLIFILSAIIFQLFLYRIKFGIIFSETYYTLPVHVIGLIVCIQALDSIRKEKLRQKAIIFFCIFSLIYGGFNFLGYPTFSEYVSMSLYYSSVYEPIIASQELTILYDEINGIYKIIANDTGKVLLDKTMYDLLIRGGGDVSNFKLHWKDTATNQIADPFYTPGLIYLGLVDLEIKKNETFEEALFRRLDLNEREKIIKNEISNGYYDKVFISPAAHGTTIWKILLSLQDENNEVLRNSCAIYSPTFSDLVVGRHNSILIYFDKDECNQKRQQVLDYFSKNYNRICEIDEWSANYVIHKRMVENKFQFYPPCRSKKTRVIEIESAKKFIDPKFILVILLILLYKKI